MKMRLAASFALSCLSMALLIGGAGPADAGPACTETASAGADLGMFFAAVGAEAGTDGGVACLEGGIYAIGAPLVPPSGITVIGVGSEPTVIECAAAVYCFKGSDGRNDVTLQDLVLDGARKADVQIGSGAAGGGVVSGWTLNRITATGAGQVGIAINTAEDITVSGSTIERNGSTPYDAVSNPTGDFGLRAVRVDALTVEDSFVYDNPTTTGWSPGFAGGAKFNTDTDLIVRGTTFRGNAGGAQLWLDIDTRGFDVSNNTIEQTANAVNAALPQEGIRVEVSCGGPTGGDIHDNAVDGGLVAAIDLYDSNGVTVRDNVVTVPSATSPNWGIRMFGNRHDPVPAPAPRCDQGANYPNRDNLAVRNAIDVVNKATASNGVVNHGVGTSAGNRWTDNVYRLRHCSAQQWMWWDGATNQHLSYGGWGGVGQDTGAASTCTSVYPEISSFTPVQAPVDSPVSITGSGLTGATSVKFGGVPASFQDVSDSHIDATVPQGAATGPICVITPAQGWCTSSDFTVGPTQIAEPQKPIVTSSAASFRLGPYDVTWSPSEGATGYGVRWRSAPFTKGFPHRWHRTTITGTAIGSPFAPGDTTCFLIDAFNASGASNSARACAAAPVDDRSLRGSRGAWTESSAGRLYQGTATRSRRRGATLRLRAVKARAISLLVQERPGGGTVDVLWNGVLLRRVSTRADVIGRRLVRVVSWSALHAGAVAIRVHSAGQPVVIDGLGLSRV